MQGRQNKELILRLLKINNAPIYHIVATRRRSKGTSRLDRIGSISPRAKVSMLKLDHKKLNKYLMERNVKMTACVAKVLNLDMNILLKANHAELTKGHGKHTKEHEKHTKEQ